MFIIWAFFLTIDFTNVFSILTHSSISFIHIWNHITLACQRGYFCVWFFSCAFSVFHSFYHCCFLLSVWTFLAFQAVLRYPWLHSHIMPTMLDGSVLGPSSLVLLKSSVPGVTKSTQQWLDTTRTLYGGVWGCTRIESEVLYMYPSSLNIQPDLFITVVY